MRATIASLRAGLRLASLPALLLLLDARIATAQAGSPLRVIRSTPAGDAGPAATISVTFDRPVAGSLDRSVDPATILSVTPAVPGRLEWRDPVTIRLVPSAPMAAATTYTVTVASGFQAMDGSALAEPHRFTFRVRGPTLLAGAPVATPHGTPSVVPGQPFALVYSSPVDLARLSSAAFLEFRASCAQQRVVPLRATGQRPLGQGDDWRLRQTGEERLGRGEDTLRRVVQLVPQAPMPRGCAGDLVAPRELASLGAGTADASRGNVRWPFVTYGELRLVKLTCTGENEACPVGPLTVEFTTPVRGAEVQRRMKLFPETPLVVRDTAGESTRWTLEARLRPNTRYALVADTAMRDVFGQPVRGNPALGYATTGYGSAVNYAFGSLVVERAFGTLSVQHINVDTLVALLAPVPDSLEAAVLARVGWSQDSIWTRLARGAKIRRVPVRNVTDRVAMTNVPLAADSGWRAGPPPAAKIVGLPESDAAAADIVRRPGSLLAVKIVGRAGSRLVGGDNPIALIQVTDLAVHARVGATEGAVWVTGVSDGLPRAGATVRLHDAQRRLLATAVTDARGLARLAWRGRAVGDAEEHDGYQRIEGYVSATLGGDRAVAALNTWDPDLSPWRFNVSSAWGDDRLPVAGAVFTERGIYRPGERVQAKAIVRDGPLGALRVPARGDSVKWIFRARDDDEEGEAGVLRERTAPLSEFGTADQSVELPAGAPLGVYSLAVQVKRRGRWRSVASTSYRVAEYRPPEFLVDLRADSAPRFPGDRFAVTAQARYLFGAKMGRAQVQWMARKRALGSWEYEVPRTEGWYVGDGASWWDEEGAAESGDDVFDNRADTLDAVGERTLSLTLPEATRGRPTQVTVEAAVTDVNRQVVSSSATTIVHPAEFYVAAKPLGDDYFWKTGSPRSIALMVVRPTGERVGGVRVQGTLVRREWHQVRRERNGVAETVGEWASDTVARCTVTPAPSAATAASAEQACTFTPSKGGMYIARFTATDAKGRQATTSLERWASGAGWIPWSDETQFKMDVVPDKQRYAVGDTATVLLASPFTNAEAWVTVEREGVILERRLRLTSGATTIKLPITEAYAPNAYVSIVVARGRSAKPGPADDPGRPTIRVGYAELRVTPEVKRLTVTLAPERAEYRPADSARVRVAVRDARGRGVRGEVALWAVDEGVLALTGYTTPDPIDLIYRARGLGMRLASNLTAVAPQVPEGEKGRREPGGGGGAEGADVLRSRFQTTAFFLGSVVTDPNGDAVAVAKLPDNLTTFRVMAVAVTAGDRYGKGESSLLVTRPLIARQALPRFVRPADAFTAGAAINRRDGKEAKVKVTAEATGVRLRGGSEREVTLAASRGTEVRFPFTAQRVDSATFRFDVTDGANSDAVRVTIPTRPDHHPQAQTIAGVLRDSATLEFPVPAGLDLARSRLSLSVGASPLATIRGIGGTLHVYPYYCTEQVISTAVPLIALYRAQQAGATVGLGRDAREDIVRAVEMLSRRQRDDGGIGYWSPSDWTTPWLSAYAGITLLDARLAGVPVDTLVLSRLAEYLRRDMRGEATAGATPVAYWQDRRETRLRDQVAAADFLSRLGRPEVAAENELLRSAAQLTLEDRARLAETLARRRQTAAARRLMEPTWATLRVEGTRAVLTDTTRLPFYFSSIIRPYARILAATLAVDPEHPLVGPLVETLAQQGRAERGWIWNTQDYSSAVSALERYERYRRTAGDRSVSVSAGSRVVLEGATGKSAGRDTTIALAGLVQGGGAARTLRLSLAAGPGTGVVFYYLTMTEIPAAPPVTPVDRGVRVERWYEHYETGKPVTSAMEGDLVRVRLRITAPTTRYFVVLDDPLPAGLEAVDLSLRTASAMAGPGTRAAAEEADHEESDDEESRGWGYGSWDSGWWSPFDHRELRDDRVVYSASVLWAGSYTASYVARATTAGTFIKPPAHAEEMYNPAVSGRSDGGTFEVREKAR